MNDADAVIALSALAHQDRLAAFRLLMRAGPHGMASGAVAEALSIAPTRMSFHLSGWSAPALSRRSATGRRIIYTVKFESMRSLLKFLTQDCCNGQPEICAGLGIPAGDPEAER